MNLSPTASASAQFDAWGADYDARLKKARRAHADRVDRIAGGGSTGGCAVSKPRISTPPSHDAYAPRRALTGEEEALGE